MGVVIPWPKPEHRTRANETQAGGPRGELLLFLGVRYERHDDDRSRSERPDDARPARGARRRKRG
jgi:hypothetical protein